VKKLLSGKFLFILAACLVVLIGLGVGSFYLFDDADAKFIKSGYVLNPLSEASERYFFNKDTGYRKNLSSMVEFTDVDKKEVSILADSFLHYDDESLSFLKNGAILDLDSIDGEGAVKFYNITSASIIEKDNDKYLIRAKNGDIVLDNFIGRINDNKYIIVGDLQLKLTGNTNLIEGEYFEIVYVEEGVVNIENKDVKYQVMADDTTIRVGRNIVIDLGDKKITSGNEDVMSLTAITIDGNENVEIIPSVTVEEKEEGEGGTGNGDGTGGGGDGTGEGNGETNGEGAGGTGQTGKEPVENIKEILITLKDVVIGSTNVEVTFDIANAKEEDSFSLQVVNLSTGRTVDMVNSVVSEVPINVSLLSPNTKYLFTVSNNRDGNKYFQKIFETAGFGIKLEKMYATSDTILYQVLIDEGTDITNAKLSLYRYDEKEKKNVPVTDEFGNPREELIETNGEGIIKEIPFDGLKSNTIYTAVLDEFSIASANFKDLYNVTLTSMTLKKTPDFSKMDVIVNAEAGQFELLLGEVVDEDRAIEKYTYKIYDKLTNEEAISPITKTNASPLIVKLGDGEDQLSNETNYYYSVIVEYFDNEKYIEYIKTRELTFIMGSDPFITVVPNETDISYDTIGGTVYLTDNSCLVNSPDRERCNGESTAILVVNEVDPSTGTLKPITNRAFKFEVNGDVVKYDFKLTGLKEGTTYTIDINSALNNDPKGKVVKISHTKESVEEITTKTLASLNVSWNVDEEEFPSNPDHVVNAGVKIEAGVIDEEDDDVLSVDETVASIKKIVLHLYEGSGLNGKKVGTKALVNIAETEEDPGFDIKTAFYDNLFNVTSDGVFELTMDALKQANDENKLQEQYTIVINAYYDEEGTKAIKLNNNVIVYNISQGLLLENVENPEITIEERNNSLSGNLFPNVGNTTIVGYKLMAKFDRPGLMQQQLEPQMGYFYVYNKSKKKVNFYIYNENDELESVNSYPVELGEIGYFEKIIYIDYGTDYYNSDTSMTRGNDYYVGFELDVVSKKDGEEGETIVYPYVGPGDMFENYKLVKTVKDTPLLEAYISKSTPDSITYAYNITDPDNALFKEKDSDVYNMYYTIGKLNTDELPDDAENIEIEPVLVEKKLPLVKVDDPELSVSTYSGTVTITGLKNGDYYSLYYKKAQTKGNSYAKDVLNYFGDKDDGMRLFDGYYDAKAVTTEGQSRYNFKYQIINNQLVDNKVTIKVLATEEMLERFVGFEVTFVDSKGNELSKRLGPLVACDENDTVGRCLSVNYADLKDAGMKSEQDVENLIRVTVDAYYDNGLTGYDFVEGTDYNFMIFQNNNTSEGMGKYVTISNGGQYTIWDPGLNVAKGFYTYSKKGNRIEYTNKFKSQKVTIPNVGLSFAGYSNKTVGTLNPKLISVDELETNNNTFSFSSITPKMFTEVNTRLINGAKIDVRLNSPDLNDMYNEGTKNKPEYYVYIDIWDDLEKVGNASDRVRPSAKVLINNDNPGATVTALVDGLEAEKTYYYNVYAKMYKDNKVEYIQLFDSRYPDKFEVRTYNFSSLNLTELRDTINVSYTSLKEPYGNRELNTTITLKSYDNEEPFNFELIYVVCDYDDTNCGIGSKNTNIFMKSFDEVFKSNVDKKDISEFNLEFDKQYYIGVYVRTTYYGGKADVDVNNPGQQDILLNKTSSNFNLKRLSDPSFVVTREALITDDGEYAIDFTVNVSDFDRTIVNGIYYVKLLDSTGKISGTLELKNQDGNYDKISGDYSKEPFDATESNKSFRISGLNPDTKYSILVFADAFLNNYVENEKDLTDDEKREKRTIVAPQSHTVYSANSYGVAFGELLYSATANSIVVSFLGGSHFLNETTNERYVSKVKYTVAMWDGPADAPSISKTYDLEADTSKKFTRKAKNEDWEFVINPPDMNNILNATYEVGLSFEVKYKGEYYWVTSADNESFNGKVKYVENNNK